MIYACFCRNQAPLLWETALLCEISKIPLETAVIGTHNLHNKSFEAKRKPRGIFRRERGRGDEGVARGEGTENNLFFTRAPFPFHVWLNRDLTIHPSWCTGVYRFQNRSRKYLQTCFLPMEEKRPARLLDRARQYHPWKRMVTIEVV